MPKNLSTVGGATELRFGKNCREDQHDNSVVINASNDKIDATKAGGFYLTPLEISTVFASDGTDATTNTFVAYNQSTKQLFRTQVPMSITGISEAGSGAEGDLNITGNLFVTGNVTSIGTVANIHVTNSQFKDGLIEIGTNNTDLTTFDLGHIYNRPVGSSNVAVCYDADARELMIAYTDSSPMDNTNQAVPKLSETMNVHVYGKLFTNSNVGVANTAPVHTLSVAKSVSSRQTEIIPMYLMFVVIRRLKVPSSRTRVASLKRHTVIKIRSRVVSTPRMQRSHLRLRATRFTQRL